MYIALLNMFFNWDAWFLTALTSRVDFGLVGNEEFVQTLCKLFIVHVREDVVYPAILKQVLLNPCSIRKKFWVFIYSLMLSFSAKSKFKIITAFTFFFNVHVLLSHKSFIKALNKEKWNILLQDKIKYALKREIIPSTTQGHVKKQVQFEFPEKKVENDTSNVNS